LAAAKTFEMAKAGSVLRAFLYAGAVMLLVLFLHSEPHVFICQEL
jgi:hypothetical protein